MTPRCARCFRPEPQCVCAWLQPIDTATKVTVLQHVGERKHPFNTARLVARSLTKGSLHLCWPDPDGAMRSPVGPSEGAVLLYPAEDAVLAEQWEGPPPSELIVLDGTWSQVRRLLADNPWLHELPCVKLAPAEGSNYRIREEPAPHCLSTIESVAQTLAGFEPDNRGLDRLLDGFERMVDHHLAARPPKRPRFAVRSKPSARDRLRDWAHVVVVYAETLGLRGTPRQLVQWAAVRPATGEVFEGLVRPAGEANTCQLATTGLDLDEASSMAVLRHRWERFVRDDDHLFAWTAATAGVASEAGLGRVTGLKELYGVGRKGVRGRLDAVVAGEGLVSEAIAVSGRASHRLGHAVAMAGRLAGSQRE